MASIPAAASASRGNGSAEDPTPPAETTDASVAREAERLRRRSYPPGDYPSPSRDGLLERVQHAIDDVRAGKMVILVDDEDRENEGDLMIAAERVTPEAINFMAKYGRGLICLTMTPTQIDRLDLPMMRAPGRRGPRLGTAFTVSIEAAHGVTTGISAADRARTIETAVSPDVRPDDIVTPGHVFPLRSRAGGVLVRAGQTEGSVDLARLAGLIPSGVICEIMNDDGTMARMKDLEAFAGEHRVRILTIADLIAYRLQTEQLVRRVGESEVVLDRTRKSWRAVVYQDSVEHQQVLALVKGQPAQHEAVLCRMHHGSTLADTFGLPVRGRTSLVRAIDTIEEEGVGVVVYLPPDCDLRAELDSVQRGQDQPLSSSAAPGQDRSPSSPAATGQAQGAAHPGGDILREYGLGAQILRELGVRRIRLLTNNPMRIAGLQGYGLQVVERIEVQ